MLHRSLPGTGRPKYSETKAERATVVAAQLTVDRTCGITLVHDGLG